MKRKPMKHGWLITAENEDAGTHHELARANDEYKAQRMLKQYREQNTQPGTEIKLYETWTP